MKTNVGIGFRRDFADELLNGNIIDADFIEFAPENWMEMGGYWKKMFDEAVHKYPVTCHGLSLSLGSPEPLDWDFIKKVTVPDSNL